VALGIPFAALMLTNSARYYQETDAIPGAHGFTALPVDVGLQLGRAIDAHLLPGGVVFLDGPQWAINSFAGRLFPVSTDVRAPAFNFIPVSGGLYIQMSRNEAPCRSAARG
jgi:hypothetical protein